MKCFIDVDGVLANFTEGVCKLFGKEESFWPTGQWDFPVEFGGEDRVYELIDHCSPQFWAELNLMPHAKAIVNLLEGKYGQENCCFLTSPPKSNPSAATGKQEWINNHFTRYRRQVLIGAAKEFCAHENAILIDDYLPNCQKFQRHGGKAILVPSRFNLGANINPFINLKEVLRSIDAPSEW